MLEAAPQTRIFAAELEKMAWKTLYATSLVSIAIIYSFCDGKKKEDNTGECIGGYEDIIIRLLLDGCFKINGTCLSQLQSQPSSGQLSLKISGIGSTPPPICLIYSHAFKDVLIVKCNPRQHTRTIFQAYVQSPRLKEGMLVAYLE